MTEYRAMLLGVGTFVVCIALCIALFVALDVNLLFMIGPAAGIAYASYIAYKSARHVVS